MEILQEKWRWEFYIWALESSSLRLEGKASPSTLFPPYTRHWCFSNKQEPEDNAVLWGAVSPIQEGHHIT